jgi:hypothetical protein
MLAPPSLPAAVLARAFRAPNGELGIRREDVEPFLTACAFDSVAVLGCEAWLIDHRAHFSGDPIPFPGQWCGVMPVNGSDIPAVFTSTVSDSKVHESWAEFVARSIVEVRAAALSFDPNNELAPKWRPYFRLNFALDTEHA